MRILLCSNFYYRRGGDCTYLLALQQLLEENGHEVAIFSMKHPENLPCPQEEYFVDFIDYAKLNKNKNPFNALRVLSRSIWSRQAKRNITRLIADWKPDIAHFQNIHAYLTPSIISPLKKAGIPIVWSLHDFKLLCPESHFLSGNRICEECKGGKFWRCTVNRCKKGSFLASFVASLEAFIHKWLKISSKIDKLIAPSQFVKQKFIEFGFSAEKLAVLPHFLQKLDDFESNRTQSEKIDQNSKNLKIIENNRENDDLSPKWDDFPINAKNDRLSEKMLENRENVSQEAFGLYAGTLMPFKGVATLLQALAKAPEHSFHILGDGPEKVNLERISGELGLKNVVFRGFLTGKELENAFWGAKYAVVPSDCYETFSYAVQEAFSHGIPVIGSDLGAIPELVQEGETGYLFPAGNSDILAQKIQKILENDENREKMGKNAQKFIENRCDRGKYAQNLLEMYEHLLGDCRGQVS